MRPTLSPGDLVLVDDSVGAQSSLSPGQIVVARHPFRATHIIKRVERIDSVGRVHLMGDNPSASTDSRSLGGIDADRVLGRVTCRVSRVQPM